MTLVSLDGFVPRHCIRPGLGRMLAFACDGQSRGPFALLRAMAVGEPWTGHLQMRLCPRGLQGQERAWLVNEWEFLVGFLAGNKASLRILDYLTGVDLREQIFRSISPSIPV